MQGGYQNYIGVDEDVQSLCEQILQLVKENGDECMVRNENNDIVRILGPVS